MSDDTSPDAAEFRCLVPFPDGSRSFVNGFEAGMVWQQLLAKPAEFEPAIAVHRENAEVFRRMGDAAGYDVHIDPVDHDWIMLRMQLRPKRFTVVNGGRSA